MGLPSCGDYTAFVIFIIDRHPERSVSHKQSFATQPPVLQTWRAGQGQTRSGGGGRVGTPIMHSLPCVSFAGTERWTILNCAQEPTVGTLAGMLGHGVAQGCKDDSFKICYFLFERLAETKERDKERSSLYIISRLNTF